MRQRRPLFRVWIACLALLACCSQPLLAADPLEGDARLAHPVTITQSFYPLDELLGGLSAQTGVRCTAEGAAADLRVTASLTRVPLRQVMEGLQQVLHLTWRRVGEGEQAEYRLHLSPDDQRAVATAQAAEWAEFRANIRRILAAATGNLPPSQDLRDRAAHNIVRNAHPRAAGQLLATLPEALLDRALRGEIVSLALGQMTPAQQEALRAYQRSAAAQRAALAAQPVTVRVQPAVPPRPARQPPEPGPLVGIILHVDRMVGEGQYARFGLRLDRGRGPAGGAMLTIDPTASIDPRDRLQIPRHFHSRQVAPALNVARKLPSRASTWSETLLQFARDNQVSVLSDAFDSQNRVARHLTIPAADAGAPTEQLLDRLCLPDDYTWNAETPLLLFRRRDWFFERERQIPERLAKRWRQVARAAGLYSLDDLAQMAALNEGQLVKLPRYAGRHAFVAVVTNRRALLLYGALRPEQRERLRAGGLTVDRLDVAQQQRLPEVVARLRPEAKDVARSLVRLEAREQEREPTATITFVFRDGERRTVTLPRRADPPADWKPKPNQFDAPLPLSLLR